MTIDVTQQERIERLIEANQNLRVQLRKLLAAQKEHVKPAQLMLPDEVIASLGAVADALVMTERWFQIQNEPGFSVARAATSTALEHALTAHRLLKRAYSR